MEGAICEPREINFFFGFDKLLITERANKLIITLVLDKRWCNQNGSIFGIYADFFFFFFAGENIDYINAMKLRGT